MPTVSYCGDLAVQGAFGEQCDGAMLAGFMCTNFGFTGGTLACKPAGVGGCTFNFAACTSPPPAATCVDSIQNQGESAVDCGGNAATNGCQRCAAGLTCGAGTDCVSGSCGVGAAGICD